MPTLSDTSTNSMVDGPFGSNLKTQDYVESGARVVRLGNIGVGKFHDGVKAFVTLDKYAQLSRHVVNAGDLLIAALAEPVARCCQAPEGLGPALVKADCFRFVPHQTLVAHYLMHYLNSPIGRRSAESLSHGVGRLRINLAELKDLPVAVCPFEEQFAIVNRVSQFSAIADGIQVGCCDYCLQELKSLERSTLSKAFRGQLVPQDPSDEPASVLLDRIRSERAAQSSPSTRGRKSSKA